MKKEPAGFISRETAIELLSMPLRPGETFTSRFEIIMAWYSPPIADEEEEP